MKSTIYFFIFGLSCLTSLLGQDIAFYADVMVTASASAHRDYAAEQFQNLLSEELEKDNSFSNSYTELEWISIQYPDDRSFRTITWQYEKPQGGYKYGGYLQTKDGAIFPYKGDHGIANTAPDKLINWENWRGGLIYKILTIPSTNGIQYFLLSFHQADAFTKCKVLESIAIDENKIFLGSKELFENPDRGNKSRRLVMEYSADSQAAINYQPTPGQLVMDHLVTIAGRIPGQGPTQAPDGTYVAYELSPDGSWKYIEKLYNQKFIDPPNGGISSKGRDIFGKPKN